MNSTVINREWDESPSVSERLLEHTGTVFENFFERSADAVWLFDPGAGVFVDCNEAAVKLIGAENKQQLLRTRPEDLSPAIQPDGSRSADRTAEIVSIVQRQKAHVFEWLMRRQDGRDVPIEVSVTAVLMGGKSIHVCICRDISERKRAERELLELNQSLERRVAERTAALVTSEARLRALVEHAPEAIVVFNGDTGRFLFGNEHACRLYGVPMEKLAELTPADVSPEFQPGGRRSSDLARELMDEALAGGMPVFEWIHQQQPAGRLISTEVRLLRLPAEGQNLIRASIMDNTERKRGERALRESEEKFRALFEGSSHGVALHDEKQLLEVNSAAVRLFGCQNAQELVGKHPGAMAPPLQPNGERSDVMAFKHIEECMTTGGVRFEWLARAPNGKEIPLEVALTRIEWSGRQVIQAYITDITERKRAQTALAESEARFSVAFQASPIFIGILSSTNGKFVLVNDALVNWLGCSRQEALGQSCADLGMWEDLADRASVLEELSAAGSIRQRECRWRNRLGERFTILLSAEKITVDHAPHFLLLALDITRRKQAEDELRTSESRLRESEARFRAAFHSSPIVTAISRASDAKFVLANDAFLNWSGYDRDEVLGRTAMELGIWESPAERQRFWNEVRAAGSIRARECVLRNRRGRVSTMLASGVVIAFNGEDHLLAMMLDINQRKQAEAELHRTLAREIELSQLKSNFVSMVSHEFRTPLGIIQSSAELLRDFYQKMQPAERDEHLESIARNTRRMADMMEEILVLSRLDAGKLDFQPRAVDLSAFCHRVLDEVLSATNQRCRIELSLSPVSARAQADERLLGHIFTNLLNNAVKYSARGTTVHFTMERDGPDAVCVVRDHGIGISEEDQQHLFKAFHRGNNVGTRPGTGLGLLLVNRCVELHGGKLQLTSRVGEGTTVTVRLPVFGGNHE
jgi:PAS domain S-box-containing protein